MSATTKIEWTEATWNPVTGCSKISEGCSNCYAKRMSARLRAMGNCRYTNGFQITVHDDLLERPLDWKKPKRIFVNSMSDLFHEDVPDQVIKIIFQTMEKAHWHKFQVLTKRSARLRELAHELPWPDNVWMGVSVENQETSNRINDLVSTPAVVKFISFEPLLSNVKSLDLKGIHWIIVGGESGPGARPMKKEWVTNIRDKCQEENIPFFFKQWGGTNKKKAGKNLDGRDWTEYPLNEQV